MSTLPSTFLNHLKRTPPHGLLHHYTGQTGLLGIVQTGRLWATKVQYMNDSTEFSLSVHAVESRIMDVLTRRYGRSLAQGAMGDDASLHGIENINIFAVCFCEESDLLSQWRGYSHSSYGFSLGFQAKKLEAAGKEHRFTLARCIYDPREQDQIAGEIIRLAVTENRTEGKLDDISIDHSMLRHLVITVGAFFKDNSFEQEHEWRLVSAPIPITNSHVNFRQGASMIVPYYDLPIPKEGQFLDTVTVGPSPHMPQSAAAVELLLMKNAMDPVGGLSGRRLRVHPSRIPFRNW